MNRQRIHWQSYLRETVLGLADLAWPNVCILCGNTLVESEETMCFQCLYELPVIRNESFYDNPTTERLLGRIPFVRATSGYRYSKESHIQLLLEYLKYKGEKRIGYQLGEVSGFRLVSQGFFSGIDVLIPVPLHPDRMRKRGYNQSEQIALGLSAASGIPVNTEVLIRKRFNPSQTTRNIWDRWTNTEGIFSLNNSSRLKGKHILLIDDVLTSGSTLEACTQNLVSVENIQISVFTLALA
jgi:ComF family protein